MIICSDVIVTKFFFRGFVTRHKGFLQIPSAHRFQFNVTKMFVVPSRTVVYSLFCLLFWVVASFRFGIKQSHLISQNMRCLIHFIFARTYTHTYPPHTHIFICIYTLLFIRNTFISNARLKLKKSQVNPKQHPRTELLLFENYSRSSYALSSKSNTTYS